MNRKNMITASQMFTLIFVSKMALTLIYTVTLSDISSLWNLLLPSLASICILPLLLLPTLLFYRKNNTAALIDVNQVFFGIMVKILYALYFFYAFLYSAFSLKAFLDTEQFDSVQAILIIIALIAAAVYASLKGIEAIARISLIILVLFLLCSVIVFGNLIPSYSSQNLIPLRLMNMSTVIDSFVFILSRFHSIAALNIFGSSIKGSIRKSTTIYVLLYFVFIVFMLILAYGTMGQYLEHTEDTVYRIIDGSGTLQRLNPLFLLVTACSCFCQFSLLHLSFTECLLSAFHQLNRKVVTIVGGAVIVFILAFTLDMQSVSEILFNAYLGAGLTIVFLTLIPLILWLISRIQNKNTKKTRRVMGVTATFLILSMMCLSFSGCTGTQLNQRMIIQGIGVDETDNQCEVTLIVLDTDNEEKENAIQLVYADGETTAEALENLSMNKGQRLLFSQCLFLMMNRSAADDCKNVLSYFTDQKDMPKNTNLMVTPISAKDTLTFAVEKYNYTSETINVVSDSKEVKQPSAHCSMLEYISNQNTENSLLLPMIEVDEDSKNLQTNGSYLLNFNGNYYPMTNNETIGTLLVNRQALNFTEVIPSDRQKISYRVENVSTKIFPSVHNDTVDIDFVLNVSLSHYQKHNLNQIQNDIYTKVQSGIDKTLIQSGSDVFSIVRYIRSAYPQEYKKVKNWSELLKLSKFRIYLSCE